MDDPEPSPDALAAHRRVLLPVIGALLSLAQARRTEDPADRAVVREAARWQALGALIVGVHAGLQVGVEAVRFVHGIGPGLGELDALVAPVLWVCTALNVLSGLAEYAFVTFWGLRAARGAELPFLGRGRPELRG